MTIFRHLLVSLVLVLSVHAETTDIKEKIKMETATLGGGCFWCVEAVYEEVEGVLDAISGYAGGKNANPKYEEVTGGDTGHAEVVRVSFNPEVITFRDILKIFFHTHDPTTLNRQGADRGTQYRSVIFYHSEQQMKEAEEMIKKITEEKLWPNPVVTELKPLEAFYKAEEYHQNYYKENPSQPYCSLVIGPKIAKLRKEFADRLKKR